MISDPTAVFLVLTAVVFISIRLHQRYRVLRSVGSVPVAVFIGMFLSNIGLLPGQSSAYQFLRTTVVDVAIVLILLSIDLRSIARVGPRMLAAFAIASVGSMIGGTIGGLMLHQQVGPEAWKLAGMYTATYTGGGLNFAALARAFNTSGDLFSVAIAADVAVTNIWLFACLTIPPFLKRGANASSAAIVVPAEESGASPAPEPAAGSDSEKWARTLDSSVRPVMLADAAALAVIGTTLLWSASRLAALVAIPQVLVLTTLALAAAQIPGVKRVAGSAVWGNYLLQLFVAGNGAQCVFANMFSIGPAVFYLASITVVVHGVFLFGVGRKLGIDAATLAVSSQSTVGGPATAVAVAGALGSTGLVLPGIAAGLLGYATGTYFGMAVGILVRHLLGQ